MPVPGTPIELGFISTVNLPTEAAYLNEGVAWASTTAALADIPAGARYAYMIINIAGELYWFLPDLTTLEAVKDHLLQDASEVSIEDVGEFFTAVDVEEALQEIGQILEDRENPYLIQLNSGQDVSDRLVGAVPPDGWTLDIGASPVDLDVNHGLTRRVESISVYAVNGDGTHDLLQGASAMAGLTDVDADNFTIRGLGRVDLPYNIYVRFAL